MATESPKKAFIKKFKDRMLEDEVQNDTVIQHLTDEAHQAAFVLENTLIPELANDLYKKLVKEGREPSQIHRLINKNILTWRESLKKALVAKVTKAIGNVINRKMSTAGSEEGLGDAEVITEFGKPLAMRREYQSDRGKPAILSSRVVGRWRTESSHTLTMSEWLDDQGITHTDVCFKPLKNNVLCVKVCSIITDGVEIQCSSLQGSVFLTEEQKSVLHSANDVKIVIDHAKE